MKQIAAAVIGCGRIAQVYRQALLSMGEEVRLTIVFDKELSRAEDFASSFPGCKASAETDPAAVAERIRQSGADIVHILLPHFLHRDYAVAALDAGLNVLTEKPIGISAEDGEAMIRARDRSGKQLAVIFQNRFIDGIQQLRESFQSGQMGKLLGVYSNLNWYRPESYYQCDWKGKWATEGGGVVIDQAIHSIDLVRYVTGLDAAEIDGHISRRVRKTIEVEDEADAAITLTDGTVYAFYATNYYAENSPIRVSFCCEKASALLTFDTVEITWKDERGKQVILPEARGRKQGEDYWGIFHEVQLRECYKALREGKPMPWSAEDAMKTLEIVLGIYQSSRENRTVVLRPQKAELFSQNGNKREDSAAE